MGLSSRYAYGQSCLDAIKKIAVTGASGKQRSLVTRFAWAFDQVAKIEIKPLFSIQKRSIDGIGIV